VLSNITDGERPKQAEAAQRYAAAESTASSEVKKEDENGQDGEIQL